MHPGQPILPSRQGTPHVDSKVLRPVRQPDHGVGLEVPVPEAEIGAGDRRLELRLAPAQRGLQLLLRMNVDRDADDLERHAGRVALHHPGAVEQPPVLPGGQPDPVLVLIEPGFISRLRGQNTRVLRRILGMHIAHP